MLIKSTICNTAHELKLCSPIYRIHLTMLKMPWPTFCWRCYLPTNHRFSILKVCRILPRRYFSFNVISNCKEGIKSQSNLLETVKPSEGSNPNINAKTISLINFKIWEIWIFLAWLNWSSSSTSEYIIALVGFRSV